MYSVVIDYNNGTVFKNNSISNICTLRKKLTCQLYVQCIIANKSTSNAISACDIGSIEILRSRYGEDRGVACSTDVGHHSREVTT